VREGLYRYSLTGGYYARIKTVSKEIRRSLATTDRDLAKRRPAKLKDDLLKIDPATGKKLHRRAIARGMAAKRGRLRPNLTCREKLVITLRQVASPPVCNREWWWAYFLRPDFQRVWGEFAIARPF